MGVRPSATFILTLLYTLVIIVTLTVYSWNRLEVNAYALLVLTSVGALLNIVWWAELDRRQHRISPIIYTYARLTIILGLFFYLLAFGLHAFLHFYDPEVLGIQTSLSLVLWAAPLSSAVLVYHIFCEYIGGR